MTRYILPGYRDKDNTRSKAVDIFYFERVLKYLETEDSTEYKQKKTICHIV